MENKKQEHWTYYLIDTTDIYVKLVDNTSKSGTKYNSYYLYWNYHNEDVLKFSTPTWNCFIIWDGKNRYMLVRVDKNDTNERTIKMVHQLESVRASEKVVVFSGDDVFSMLVDDSNDNDCEDYDDQQR